MIDPISAPPIAPDNDTVRARWPSHAVATLTRMAHGSAPSIAVLDASNASTDIRLPSHSTTAAEAGTVSLSSRRMGIVSTSAAINAAASGAATVNIIEGGGTTAGRVHHESATAPMPPQTTNAAVPATLLSRFHGRRPRLNADVISGTGGSRTAFTVV